MSYEATAASWKTVQMIAWNLVRDALAKYLREVISTFSRNNSDRIVYGVVVVRGQNWELSVYLNTEEGYRTMPERFRPMCRNCPPKTDEELLDELGRWYFDAWDFDLYEFKCRPELNALNNLHDRVFSPLRRESTDEDSWYLSARFLQVCAEATVILESSAEIQALQRTDDFEIRFFDASSLEWDTDAVMKKAREDVCNLRGC